MRLGDLAHLSERLQTLGLSDSLNTAFVERLNLTLRHALAALSRRSWATAQLAGELLAHLEGWRAYYHFCRPLLSLRFKLDMPQARGKADATPLWTAYPGHGGRSPGSSLVSGGVVSVPRGSAT